MTKPVLLIIAASFCFQAISAEPDFEVASVRVNREYAKGGEGKVHEAIATTPLSLNMTFVTMYACLRWAYGVKDFQIAGAPRWFGEDRYDIVAKASQTSSPAQMRLMLRTLLAERFQIALRRETKEVPVYALQAIGKPKGLVPSSGDGPVTMAPSGGGLEFRHFTMEDFADALPRRPLSADRPVLDKTGLAGAYDFALQFADSGNDLKKTMEAMDQGTGPSIYDVIRQQLGLRLVPQKGPIEVLAIDRAERRPSGN